MKKPASGFQGEAISFDDERAASVTGFNHLISQQSADVGIFRHGRDGKVWPKGAPRLQARLSFIVVEGSGEIALVMGEKMSETGTSVVGDRTILGESVEKRRRSVAKKPRTRIVDVLSAPFPNPARGKGAKGEVIRIFKVFLTGMPVVMISCLSIAIRGVE